MTSVDTQRINGYYAFHCSMTDASIAYSLFRGFNCSGFGFFGDGKREMENIR